MKKLSKIIAVSFLSTTLALSSLITALTFNVNYANASNPTSVTVEEYAQAVSAKAINGSASYVQDVIPWNLSNNNTTTPLTESTWNTRVNLYSPNLTFTGIELKGKQGSTFDLGYVDLNAVSSWDSADYMLDSETPIYSSFINMFPNPKNIRGYEYPTNQTGTSKVNYAELNQFTVTIKSVTNENEYISVRMTAGGTNNAIKFEAAATNNDDFTLERTEVQGETKISNCERSYYMGDVSSKVIPLAYDNGAIYTPLKSTYNSNSIRQYSIRNYNKEATDFVNGEEKGHVKWAGFTEVNGKRLVNISVKFDSVFFYNATGEETTSLIVTKLGEHDFDDKLSTDADTKQFTADFTIDNTVKNKTVTVKTSKPATYEMPFDTVSVVVVEGNKQYNQNENVELPSPYYLNLINKYNIDCTAKIYKVGDSLNATDLTFTNGTATHKFTSGGNYVIDYYVDTDKIGTSTCSVFETLNGVTCSTGATASLGKYAQAGNGIEYSGINLTGGTNATFDLGYIDLSKSSWDGTVDSLTDVGNSFIDVVFNPSVANPLSVDDSDRNNPKAITELSSFTVKLAQGNKTVEFVVEFYYNWIGDYNEFVITAKADNQTSFGCYRYGESALSKKVRKGSVKPADANILYGVNSRHKIGSVGYSQVPLSLYFENNALYTNSTYRDTAPEALTKSYLIRDFGSEASNLNNAEVWSGFDSVSGKTMVNVSVTFGEVNATSGVSSIVISKLGNFNFADLSTNETNVICGDSVKSINYSESFVVPQIKLFNVISGYNTFSGKTVIKRNSTGGVKTEITNVNYVSGDEIDIEKAGIYTVEFIDTNSICVFSYDFTSKMKLTFNTNYDEVQLIVNDEEVDLGYNNYYDDTVTLKVNLTEHCNSYNVSNVIGSEGEYGYEIDVANMLLGDESEVNVLVNVILKQYTVNFKFYDDIADLTPVTFNVNDYVLGNVTFPQATNIDGKKFLGWFLNGVQVTSIADLPCENVTLYGAYGNAKKVISFNDGTTVENQEVNAGNKVTSVIPEKEGYVFDGWYTDSEFTNKFDFNTVINSDITLYAKWIEADYIVGENGTVIPPVNNTEIIEPTNNVNAMQIVFIAVGSLCFIAGAIIIVLNLIKKRKN